MDTDERIKKLEERVAALESFAVDAMERYQNIVGNLSDNPMFARFIRLLRG